MTDIRAKLLALREQANAATPGPWTERLGYLMSQTSDDYTIQSVARVPVTEDRDFIASSRSAVPQLIAALEAVLDLCDKGTDAVFPLTILEQVRSAISEAMGDGE